MITQVRAEVQSYLPELIAIRRDIHRHPETGFEEFRTADIVAEKLQSWNIPVSRGIAKTGVIGTLAGKRSGRRTIGLRADMDALPMVEANTFEHRSAHAGRMHACGHDGHTTMLLGAARYLAAHNDFAGTVHFIFQPAEESFGGARVMIEDGLLERYPCDAIYGMHNFPSLEAGRFGIRTGPMMAASDTWTAVFRGTGGHGGVGAHKGTDPTCSMAQFLTAVQTIVGRSVAPSESAVVSVGCLSGGSLDAPNVIPSEVTVCGTARSFTPETRLTLERRLGELAGACAAAYGCDAELEYRKRYPPLVNSKAEVEVAVSAARAVVGHDNVISDIAPFTGGEDFAFFLEKAPGAYMFIGNDRDGEASIGLHDRRYDFNDDIISLGVSYFIEIINLELCR